MEQTRTTKKAAHSTTDRTAKAPNKGAENNNSNFELKNQVLRNVELENLQLSKPTRATAAKVEETKEPPYMKIMGYVYGITQRFSNKKLTAKESVMLIRTFLTEHGA